jgi:hypothetical protein
MVKSLNPARETERGFFDTADELVLYAAANASAHSLLTFNLKHFADVAKRFNWHVSPPGPFIKSLP